MRTTQRLIVGCSVLLLFAIAALMAACGNGPRTTIGAGSSHPSIATATAPLDSAPTDTPLLPIPTDTPTQPPTETPVLPPPTQTPALPPPTPTNTPVPPTPTPTTVTIVIASSPAPGGFPATITVPAGTHLIWHNGSDVPHSATSISGPASFDSGNIAVGGDSIAITLTVPGTYSYHCAYHPSMTGQIIVT
jgi:plastocyanin